MANLKMNMKRVLAQHWRDAEGTQRSITLGPVDEDEFVTVPKDQLADLWDSGLSHGRATQGRRKGKALRAPSEPEHIGVQEAIDNVLATLRDGPSSTYFGAKSNLKLLKEKLGSTWPGWVSGYWAAIDAATPGTRAGRRRAANKLANDNLGRIPDFRAVTAENHPGTRNVEDVRRQKRAGSGKTVKSYLPHEATPMLATLPSNDFPEYVRLVELVAAYMGMHLADALNLLRLKTPRGAEKTRIDWENATYFGCRQKSPTYFKDVPIPGVVMRAIRPYKKGQRLAYPWEWPESEHTYRKRHEELESVAGVDHIDYRSVSGWRHYFISVLSCELEVADVVIKALVAQETLDGEKVAAVAGRVKDGDVLLGYQHAWPAAMREASDAFEAHMAKLIAEHEGTPGGCRRERCLTPPRATDISSSSA